MTSHPDFRKRTLKLSGMKRTSLNFKFCHSCEITSSDPQALPGPTLWPPQEVYRCCESWTNWTAWRKGGWGHGAKKPGVLIN